MTRHGNSMIPLSNRESRAQKLATQPSEKLACKLLTKNLQLFFIRDSDNSLLNVCFNLEHLQKISVRKFADSPSETSSEIENERVSEDKIFRPALRKMPSVVNEAVKNMDKRMKEDMRMELGISGTSSESIHSEKG